MMLLRLPAIWFCLWVFAVTGMGAPVITGVTPAQGEPGTQVVITGNGFGDAVEVKFNTAPSDFLVLASDRMVATVPVGGVSGQISVIGLSGTATTGGSFLVAPRISGFLPRRSGTNTLVNLFGENFESAVSVWFNEIPAPFQIVGPKQITALVPFGATNGSIWVEALSGVAVTAENFTVTSPLPIVDGFSPAVVPPGETVVIEGANFIRVTGVQFNGVAAATFSATSETQIRAVVPAGATTGPVRVLTALGTASSTNALIVTRAPVITEFTPTVGPANTLVTISGINLQNITGVAFNGVTAVGFGSLAQDQISAIVPANATAGPIRVTNIFGTGVSAASFVVTKAPVVTNVFPLILKAGEILTVEGVNFTGATLVRFNGGDAIPSVVAMNQLHVVVPLAAGIGPVSVVNPFGSGSSGETVQVIGNAPWLVEATPASGPRGMEVILTGANFQNVTAVRFNGTTTAFSVTAPTQIHAVVPAAATSGRLTVTTPFGTSTNEILFHVPPRLTSVTPASGVVGDTIALNGANFVDVSSVTIGGQPVPFAVAASNLITATLANNTRSGPVAIRTPGGVIISSGPFTMRPGNISFSPALGPVGTSVTITGTSFFDVGEVSFGGGKAVFETRSSEEIVAQVPTDAKTGPIQVTTPGGTSASTETFLLTSASDLVASAVVSPNPVVPGTVATSTITVTNRGPSTVTGVVLTDTPPANAVFISATSPRGGCGFTNGIVTCNLGAMKAGEALEITVRTRPDTEGVFSHRVHVEALEPDPLPANNTVSPSSVVVRDESRTLRVESAPDGKGVVLSWPVSPVGFILQSAPRCDTPAAWVNTLPAPVAGAGWNRVTNGMSNTLLFYRLIREF